MILVDQYRVGSISLIFLSSPLIIKNIQKISLLHNENPQLQKNTNLCSLTHSLSKKNALRHLKNVFNSRDQAKWYFRKAYLSGE